MSVVGERGASVSPEMETMRPELGRLDELFARLLDDSGPSENQLDAGLASPGEIQSPLDVIVERLSLDAVERDILLFCVAPGIDEKYTSILIHIHASPERMFMTPELCFRLLRIVRPAAAMGEVIEACRRLMELRLLEWVPAERFHYFNRAPMTAARRMLEFILGGSRPDEELEFFLSDAIVRSIEGEERNQRIIACAEFIAAAAEPYSVRIHAPDRGEADGVANGLARNLRRRLLVLDLDAFVISGRADLIPCLARDLNLLDSILYIPGIQAHAGTQTSPILRLLLRSLENHTVLMASSGDWPDEGAARAGRCLDLRRVVPGLDERANIWENTLAHVASEDPFNFQQLAARYNFSEHRIRASVNYALGEAGQRGNTITSRDINTGAGIQGSRRLSEYALQVDTKYAWDDLILPSRIKNRLRDLTLQFKKRHLVFNEWNFGEKQSRGGGLCALFGGPSGTGKTMASGIIARELELELFKVDLSRIASKYIGETEKNLARVFDEAAESQAILFFDEADALFGKRSEVRDAHDRYANMEVNYLLQKMEEYPGMAILSSNLRENMDDAFLRRLRFIVEFPFPDTPERERIWRAVFPGSAPLSADINFELLSAKVKLAGGAIRNAAVNAAFKAAQAQGVIGMREILAAVRDEYEKESQPFMAGDFGEYADMIRESEEENE